MLLYSMVLQGLQRTIIADPREFVTTEFDCTINLFSTDSATFKLGCNDHGYLLKKFG